LLDQRTRPRSALLISSFKELPHSKGHPSQYEDSHIQSQGRRSAAKLHCECVVAATNVVAAVRASFLAILVHRLSLLTLASIPPRSLGRTVASNLGLRLMVPLNAVPPLIPPQPVLPPAQHLSRDQSSFHLRLLFERRPAVLNAKRDAFIVT